MHAGDVGRTLIGMTIARRLSSLNTSRTPRISAASPMAGVEVPCARCSKVDRQNQAVAAPTHAADLRQLRGDHIFNDMRIGDCIWPAGLGVGLAPRLTLHRQLDPTSCCRATVTGVSRRRT